MVFEYVAIYSSTADKPYWQSCLKIQSEQSFRNLLRNARIQCNFKQQLYLMPNSIESFFQNQLYGLKLMQIFQSNLHRRLLRLLKNYFLIQNRAANLFFLLLRISFDSLEIRPLTPEELPAAIRFTAKVHSQFEPFSHSIGSTYEDCVSLFTLLMGQFQEVVQIGAFKDGQLVGASLNNDLYFTVPVKREEVSPIWEPVGAAMRGIRSQLEEEGALVRVPGRHFHVYFVATAPEMKGQGIATRMLDMVLKIAADAGFEYSFIECTNPGMVRAAQKSGFQLLKTLSYIEFEYKGGYPFENFEKEYGTQTCEFMGLQLQKLRIKKNDIH